MGKTHKDFCPRCGQLIRLEDSRTYDLVHQMQRTGIYCSCCGRWIRWISNREARELQLQSQTADAYDTFISNMLKEAYHENEDDE